MINLAVIALADSTTPSAVLLTLPNKLSAIKLRLKGNVNLISSDPPFVGCHVRITTHADLRVWSRSQRAVTFNHNLSY